MMLNKITLCMVIMAVFLTRESEGGWRDKWKNIKQCASDWFNNNGCAAADDLAMQAEMASGSACGCRRRRRLRSRRSRPGMKRQSKTFRKKPRRSVKSRASDACRSMCGYARAEQARLDAAYDDDDDDENSLYDAAHGVDQVYDDEEEDDPSYYLDDDYEQYYSPDEPLSYVPPAAGGIFQYISAQTILIITSIVTLFAIIACICHCQANRQSKRLRGFIDHPQSMTIA